MTTFCNHLNNAYAVLGLIKIDFIHLTVTSFVVLFGLVKLCCVICAENVAVAVSRVSHHHRPFVSPSDTDKPRK